MAVATDTSSHSKGQDNNGTSGGEDALQALLMRRGGETGSHQSYVDLPGSSSSGSSTYLHSLTSKSLADLRLQPSALTTTIHSLDSQLSTLCARHVDSFVQVRHASSSLPRALDDLDAKLDSLLDDALPRLVQATQQFPSASQPHFQAKARAQALLRQHQNSLADVLELPALLATCVRANHPVEALQLGIHIARLSRPANPNSDDAYSSSLTPLGEGARGHGVLVALRREAWKHLVVLRDDLLKGLDTRGLRLPVARRYVSLLKTFSEVDREAGHANTPPPQQHSSKNASLPPRLALSDSMLCLSLLRSRYAALVSRLDNATASQAEDAPATAMAAAASRCSTRIGMWREAVYDAIGMSLALFVDRPPHSSLYNHKEGEDSLSMEGSDDDGDLSPTMLISAFASKTLHLLNSLLDADIPDITSSAFQQQYSNAYARMATDVLSTFASLHTQLSYASASLARLGLDFSSTLTGSLTSSSSSAFEHGVLQVWTLGLRRATESFTQRWTSCVGSGSGNGTAIALLSPKARNVETTSKLLSRDRGSNAEEQEDKRMTTKMPCQDLTYVPALAILLNNLLEAYNALQGFCPVTVGERIVEELDEALEHILVLALQFQERLDLSEEGTNGADDATQGGNKSGLDASLLPTLSVVRTEQGGIAHDDGDEILAASTKDPQRLHEAQRMLASAVSVLLEQDVVGFIRSLVVELVSADSDTDKDDIQTTARQRCSQRRREVVAWAEEARMAWDIGEEKRESALRVRLEASRKERERVESERTARLKREEEEAAMRAEEEEAAERARLIKEQEEEAERAMKEAEAKRRLEEEERVRRAKEEEKEAERRREVERREEEERLKREREEREAAEKQRKEEEEQRRLREEQERLRREEEEAQAKREEEVRLKREEEARLKREEEERLKKEEEKRLEREEEERKRIEEEKRIEREKEEKAEKQRRREEEEKQREEQKEQARREQEALGAAKKAQEEEEEKKREKAEVERKKVTMAKEEEERNEKEAGEEAKESAAAQTQAENNKPEGDEAEEVKPNAASTASKKAGSSALADKLRKAREERERAAAEANTATSSSESAPVTQATKSATGETPEAEEAKTEAAEDAGAVSASQQQEALHEGQETPISKGSQSSGEDDGEEEGNEDEGKEDETAASSSAAAAKKKAKKKRQKKKKAGTAATASAAASATTQ